MTTTTWGHITVPENYEMVPRSEIRVGDEVISSHYGFVTVTEVIGDQSHPEHHVELRFGSRGGYIWNERYANKNPMPRKKVRRMRKLDSGTAAHTRASSLYALEVPCTNGMRDTLLDQLREACPTLVAASFPTPGGVTIGFRAPNDDEAILIATATLGVYAGTLHTGLGVNQRMVAVTDKDSE